LIPHRFSSLRGQCTEREGGGLLIYLRGPEALYPKSLRIGGGVEYKMAGQSHEHCIENLEGRGGEKKKGRRSKVNLQNRRESKYYE